MALPRQRLHFHKDFGDAIAHIFIINLLHGARFPRNWFTDLSDQLLTGFIHVQNPDSLSSQNRIACQEKTGCAHADLGILGAIRVVVYPQNIFHRRYERCVAFGRDFPVLAEVRLKFFFLTSFVQSCVKLILKI